ncbi:MAG TPA: efflux RND transporter periplasmic adaptor subunit [Polyangiaceae bacterium]|nr:efflux RND transporter periplasmic adaptor subunit [Polyangiaceae bacterium]
MNEHSAVAPRVGPRARLLTGIALALSACSVLWQVRVRMAHAPLVIPAADVPTVKGRTVTLSSKLRERLEIQTAAVRDLPLTPLVRSVGTVTFDPAYVGAVGVRMRGVVRNVYKFEGDVVKRGELLGDVVSSELGAAQANVLMYQAQLKSAELNAKREADLVLRGLTTMREVEEAQAELAEYKSRLLAAEQAVSAFGGAAVKGKKVSAIGVHQLLAPIDGTVVELFVAPGQSVEAHQTALRVADLDHLWVELSVFERDLPSVHQRDRVEISPLSQQESVITGEVAHVGEVIDPQTRAGHVRVEIDNEKRALRVGQAVSARIHTAGAAAAVRQVPATAITYIDGKATVFKALSETEFVATPVVTGETDGTSTQIVSGVAAGESVVSKGVFGLKSELFR